MNTAFVLVYALTCGISGYVSGRLYKSMEGQNWAWNIILTSCVFSVPFFVIWSIVNSVAWFVRGLCATVGEQPPTRARQGQIHGHIRCTQRFEALAYGEFDFDFDFDPPEWGCYQKLILITCFAKSTNPECV